MFDNEILSHLTNLYEQLHQCTVGYVLPFHVCSGRLAVGSDILGLMLNSRSAISSSIIAAYWPTRGSAMLEANTSKKVLERFVILLLTV